MEAYGEELERRNMDEDAGLVFMAAGMPERAIEAYVVAGQWRMAMALAGAQELRRPWDGFYRMQQQNVPVVGG